MQFDRRKSKVTAVSLLLMFAMAVSFVSLPTANAQSIKATTSYIGALPNPVGVSEQVLLHVGITDALPGVQYGWEGLSVTIERPDGTTETISGVRTDSTGGTGIVYVPTMAGNYTLQTHFPEQWFNRTYRGMTISTLYKASDSFKLTLVVQEEPLSHYPGHPLPTEYWTRPIDSQLREWYVLGGSWLTNPENLHADPGNDGAPDTAHILWTTPLTSGGLVGGDVGLESSINYGAVGFGTGDAYEGKFSSRFIIAGRLYYTAGGARSEAPVLYHCVDLHTGEEIWAKTFLDNQSISMGQLFYWQSYNYMGTFAYLWVQSGPRGGPYTWYAFDAFTGDWRATITDAPSGSTVVGKNGEIYLYSISTSQRTMLLWNLSALVSMHGSWGNSFHMRTFNASATTSSGDLTTAAQRAYALNITIPEHLPGRVTAVWLNDRVVGADLDNYHVSLWGFSLEPGQEGQLLFNKTWNAPAYWAEENLTVSGFGGGWMAWSQEDKVGVLWLKETREHYGFSLETGDYLWGPTEPQYYLDAIDDSSASVRNIAYGRFYSASLGGIVYCYNVTTGERLWTYEAKDYYHDYLMANNWWLKPMFICDDKIYVGHCEHSANQPLPRGAPFICINATTGEEIFRADSLFRQTRWGGRAIIGDSIIAAMDTYDQRVYAIGKGPSATTVSAGPKVSVHGDSVVVEGMVTDISPGTQGYSKTSRFPNGVPAVCDENMSEWMLYVYKQFARPADAVGVEVVIEVLDPNNNFYEVARTTSDSSGYFGCTFVPEVPGKYNVIASFEGSGAYYGSSAETFINVEEVPAATPAPTPTPAPMTDTYVLGIGSAILIAVIIGFILLLLRKR